LRSLARHERKHWRLALSFATRPVHGTIVAISRRIGRVIMRQNLRLLIMIALFGLIAAGAPAARAQDTTRAKARALVDAAIKMTNSTEALKLLWQATDIDPSYQDAYVYLGLYYNSRADYANVVKVYQKLIKYQPNQIGAYLNIGEAYMALAPPRPQDALVYFRKAYQIDPKNTYAALRMGEILLASGSRDDAIKYLRQALADTSDAHVSGEAEKVLRQAGAL
jgi:tetratricopeptide (TPR) repeat protein